MTRAWLVLLLAATVCAADPYDVWAQGRPGEAVAPLIAAAEASGRWDAWLDAGLAAEAAGARGRAVACLARAHRLAPERSEPRTALRALGAALPTTWSERAGPLAWPGQGWPALALLSVAGLGLGLAVAHRRGAARTAAAVAAGAALLAALPGQVALHLDAGTVWEAAVRDTQALDSTGAPRQALPAGTLLARAAAEPWAGRVLVRLADGSPAYVPAADLDPRP